MDGWPTPTPYGPCCLIQTLTIPPVVPLPFGCSTFWWTWTFHYSSIPHHTHAPPSPHSCTLPCLPLDTHHPHHPPPYLTHTYARPHLLTWPTPHHRHTPHTHTATPLTWQHAWLRTPPCALPRNALMTWFATHDTVTPQRAIP